MVGLKEKMGEDLYYEGKLQEIINLFNRVITEKTKEEKQRYFKSLIQKDNYLGEKLRDDKGGRNFVNKLGKAIDFLSSNYELKKW